jgi:ELWxxDGT repeat protein
LLKGVVFSKRDSAMPRRKSLGIGLCFATVAFLAADWTYRSGGSGQQTLKARLASALSAKATPAPPDEERSAAQPAEDVSLSPLDGQNPYLVKDINTLREDISSSPQNLVNVNGVLFFSATDGYHDYELWKSDGTAAGTVLVKDINPGIAGSNPQNLTAVNGTAFFSASDGTNGSELWKSDGTAAGTILVKDINPGSGSSYPQNLTNVNGTLFFTANDGTHGTELWKSDGTSEIGRAHV